MPARKIKTEDVEPEEVEPERDRGPGPDQAKTIAARWDDPKDAA